MPCEERPGEYLIECKLFAERLTTGQLREHLGHAALAFAGRDGNRQLSPEGRAEGRPVRRSVSAPVTPVQNSDRSVPQTREHVNSEPAAPAPQAVPPGRRGRADARAGASRSIRSLIRSGMAPCASARISLCRIDAVEQRPADLAQVALDDRRGAAALARGVAAIAQGHPCR